MKNLIFFFYLYSMSALYEEEKEFFWIYLSAIALFWLLHFTPKYLIKVYYEKNSVRYTSNFGISIVSSLIYLFVTVIFLVKIFYDYHLTLNFRLVLIVMGSISHLIIPSYFLRNFIISLRKNKNDYIAISAEFIECHDNGNIRRMELCSILKEKTFFDKNGILTSGDEHINISMLGLSQISKAKLIAILNSSIENYIKRK